MNRNTLGLAIAKSSMIRDSSMQFASILLCIRQREKGKKKGKKKKNRSSVICVARSQ